ncbi:bifunctional adenosylcobinamide kinase/adenosylcobinamide-phosphate guanylyltransferase [Sulfurimonas sp. SAG-AH-194-I05]|nr:bifunctional adenosylcobinamide kinase/adenosylcobinamide-phosphate guanylyltransferase [Sulfurimonas sp. SAG-AH-194-I05]MDF1875334.1 bifunctional adenosylcobinamide kinase/adenosylcobinamide-phosphate guanylyltransferase [Sulfurimonas sp. SAG-AH-194-I05]
MQTLFIGGIKSGKSRNAEEYILKHSLCKPIYLATNEVFDEGMTQRVQAHKEQRKNNFITIEEPLKLFSTIKKQDTHVLVECVSMWINNMLFHKRSEKEILEHIEQINALHVDIVWVINDVSCSVVSENKLVRDFVDINGRVSQLLASTCEKVFSTVAGISLQIK